MTVQANSLNQTTPVDLKDAFIKSERPQPSNPIEVDVPNPSRSGQRRLRTENRALAQNAMPDELALALLKYGHNSDGIPALHAAIKAQDEATVRLFLQHGVNPNSKSRADQWTNPCSALDFAAAYGNKSLVTLLIDAGAKIDSQSIDGPNGARWDLPSPLIFASIFNNSETIRTLVLKGASLTPSGITSPLHAAALFGATESVKTLISLGVPPDLKDNSQIEPIPCAISFYGGINKLNAIEVLLQAGANPNWLHQAVRDSNQDPIAFSQLLLKYGADINLLDHQGHTPLFYATGPLADFLKSRGAISK